MILYYTFGLLERSELFECMLFWKVTLLDQREALQASDWDWRALEATDTLSSNKIVIIFFIIAILGICLEILCFEETLLPKFPWKNLFNFFFQF